MLAKQSVYEYVDGSEPPEHWQRALGAILAYPAIAAVGQLPSNRHIPRPGGEITETQIQAFAENAEAILIGAWDACDYLVWREL